MATTRPYSDLPARLTTTIPVLLPAGSVIRFRPWDDPALGRHGVDVRSGYVERFWLPVLGPSAVLALRHLADQLEASPGGVEVDLDRTARWLGLGGTASRHAPLRRALGRCVRFGLARPLGPTAMEVRRTVGPVPRRQLVRLPDELQDEHRRWEASLPDPGTLEVARRRARLLALDLLEVTGERGSVERRLLRAGVHPALAEESASWAWARMAEAALAAATSAGRPTGS